MPIAPSLDPVKDPATCRAIREFVRFAPSPKAWTKTAKGYGFANHASLYQVAARYEKAFGLATDEREDADVVAARESGAANS